MGCFHFEEEDKRSHIGYCSLKRKKVDQRNQCRKCHAFKPSQDLKEFIEGGEIFA